jgi:hypothetical protein
MPEESSIQTLPEKVLPEIDIFTKQILGKKVLNNVATLWQEKYTEENVAVGVKRPFRLYIINNGSVPGPVPDLGSPVRCVKLCKRVIETDYPRNTLICNSKSKVTHRYQLVLLVEFEDGTFDVLTLPRNLSNRLQYNALTTKAFVDSTVINAAGVPVLQHQTHKVPNESLIIVSAGVNNYTSFEYSVSIPFTDFTPHLNRCVLDDPSLQSYILLKDLKYDIDVLDTFQVDIGGGSFVWTTIVELTVTEDIIDKLGIDQDVIIQGKPEFICK